jgi:hypothetical protein
MFAAFTVVCMNLNMNLMFVECCVAAGSPAPYNTTAK